MATAGKATAAPGATSAEREPETDAAGEVAKPAESAAPGLNQIAKVFGSIVAPTTLFTALLYYFGWNHAYWLFNYFGVNSTVLGLTTGDYLQRSVDALFVPMSVIGAGGLLAMWGNAEIHSRLAAGSRPRLLRIALPIIASAGVLLAISGFVSIFTTTMLTRYLTAAPFSLASGVLLLTYTNHLRRSYPSKTPPVPKESDTLTWAAAGEWASVFTLVAISLFWAATDYAAAVGTTRARDLLAQLPTSPSVVLYSNRSLNLNLPGVHQTHCHDQQSAYPFRYDGLKLILRSGNQYLFLPQTWKPTNGTAVLLPQSDTIRLEFTPAHNTTLDITC